MKNPSPVNDEPEHGAAIRGELRMGRQIRGILMLGLTAFIWGTAFVAQRVGMDHVGPVTFIAVRFLIGAISLLPVICVGSLTDKKRGAAGPYRSTRLLLKSGVLCGIVIFVCGMFQQIGIQYTTVGKSGFITTLYIVIVPIFGRFLGKRLRFATWACILVAMAGMYLLCVNEAVSINKGDVYTFFCAVFYAVHILVVDRYSPQVDGVKLSAIQFFVCSMLGFAGAFIFEAPNLSAIVSAIWPLMYAGVLSSGVAFTLQILGQRDVNPVAASLVMSLESVFAALTGWTLLGEMLAAREIVGCAMIFVANIMVQTLSALKKS
jgi:drug/metabolite transporter (DMT)-like permease